MAAPTYPVLGLEGWHDLSGSASPPGFSGGYYGMNYRADRTGISFDSMPGFHSAPDFDDKRDPAPSRHGEIWYPGLQRGKTFSVEGRVYGEDYDSFREQQAYLRQVCAGRDVTWSIYNAWDETWDYNWRAIVRVLQLDMDEIFEFPRTHPRGGWQQSFTMAVRMSDARWYWNEWQEYTSSLVNTAFPVTNAGNAPTDNMIIEQTLNVSGLTTWNPVIYNDTLGKKMQLTVPVTGLSFTGTIYWNFYSRTITWNLAGGGEVDCSYYLNREQSNWWDYGQVGLKAGVNNIRQNNGTGLTVGFEQASW